MTRTEHTAFQIHRDVNSVQDTTKAADITSAIAVLFEIMQHLGCLLEILRLHGEGGNFADCLPAKNIRKFSAYFPDFLKKFAFRSGAKVCESCRSRKMLKNDYLVAKIGVDTAENEPFKSGVNT